MWEFDEENYVWVPCEVISALTCMLHFHHQCFTFRWVNSSVFQLPWNMQGRWAWGQELRTTGTFHYLSMQCANNKSLLDINIQNIKLIIVIFYWFRAQTTNHTWSLLLTRFWYHCRCQKNSSSSEHSYSNVFITMIGFRGTKKTVSVNYSCLAFKDHRGRCLFS